MRKLAAALVTLTAGVGFVAARQAGYFGGLRTAPEIVVSGPPIFTVRDTLRARETVSQLFERRGVHGVDWSALAQAVRNFNPGRLRAGMVFTFRRRHGEPEPHAVVVRVSYDSRLHLRRTGAEWSASVENIPWRIEQMRAEGVIRNTLYDAMDAAVGDELLPAGARRDLVWGLSEVYDWSVDFTRDIQDGDRFEVVAERLVSAEGEVRYGRVLAARLDVAARPQYAFLFDEGPRPEYYDEKGHSMKREFLRAPVAFKRISSRFSGRRLQPILRVYRAHRGTDFAANLGTPVRAVADGAVQFAGRDAGYGNLIELRHSGQVETRYAHLLGFAEGVHTGVRVRQGETIGFVGCSGLCTGPHLHYEVRVGGRAVNPRRQLGVGAGPPIPASQRAAFEREKERLLDLLEPRTAPVQPRAD
ncbi:MAG: peptidoglycan DD-metalloendopeptidase family protein [Gemmatimonadota bacterium]